ncbi:MAG: hypothetical protein LQ349_002212 [Xanthoria aureola]|nr:MAG: hypothetical protein LQ349_002212 [Xanthoria aureola]
MAVRRKEPNSTPGLLHRGVLGRHSAHYCGGWQAFKQPELSEVDHAGCDHGRTCSEGQTYHLLAAKTNSIRHTWRYKATAISAKNLVEIRSTLPLRTKGPWHGDLQLALDRKHRLINLRRRRPLYHRVGVRSHALPSLPRLDMGSYSIRGPPEWTMKDPGQCHLRMAMWSSHESRVAARKENVVIEG